MCSRETDRQCHSLLFVEHLIEEVFDIMTFSVNENVTTVLNRTTFRIFIIHISMFNNNNSSHIYYLRLTTRKTEVIISLV